jgi:hypothetical protein
MNRKQAWNNLKEAVAAGRSPAGRHDNIKKCVDVYSHFRSTPKWSVGRLIWEQKNRKEVEK